MRAVPADTDAAGLVGKCAERVSTLALAPGGTLNSTFFTLDASIGVIFTTKALIIIVCRVGDSRSAVVAAVITGVVETAVRRSSTRD